MAKWHKKKERKNRPRNLHPLNGSMPYLNMFLINTSQSNVYSNTCDSETMGQNGLIRPANENLYQTTENTINDIAITLRKPKQITEPKYRQYNTSCFCPLA